MQPPFQQSAASAHIDDLMRAAPAGSQAAARVTNFDFPIQYRI